MLGCEVGLGADAEVRGCDGGGAVGHEVDARGVEGGYLGAVVDSVDSDRVVLHLDEILVADLVRQVFCLAEMF